MAFWGKGMFSLLHENQSSTFIQDISENPTRAVYLIFPIFATLFHIANPILQFVIYKQTDHQKNMIYSIQKQMKVQKSPSLQTVVCFPLLILFSFLSSYSMRQHRRMFFFPVQIMTAGVLVPTLIIRRDPKMVKFYFETLTNPLVDKTRETIFKTFATKIQPLE